MRMEKVFLVLFILLSLNLYSQTDNQEALEKRIVFNPVASKIPSMGSLNIPLVFGRVIDVVSFFYKNRTLWLKFKTKSGMIYYIPESYTGNINSEEETHLRRLKTDPDETFIDYHSPVGATYRPDDIKLITAFTFRNGSKLRKEAALAFFKMARDAEYQGCNLMAKRGYVSPEKVAEEFYNKLSAYKSLINIPYEEDRPGVSPLHSGVVVDITSKNANYKCEVNFYFSKEYKWLIKNARAYGFYPWGGSADIYSFKPYRFRYFFNSKLAKAKMSIPDIKTVDIFGIGKLIIAKKSGADITYFKIHDEETTASRTMRFVFNKYGGRFIEFINTSNLNNRNIYFIVNGIKYKIDPNRIFTDKGFAKMLKVYNPSYNKSNYPAVLNYIRKVRAKILYHIRLRNNKPFFYIHTNKYYTVLSTKYLAKLNRRGRLFKIYRNGKLHPKVFLYMLRADDFNYFKKTGISCIFQKRGGSGDDGSLSYYAEKNVPRIRYITIETINEDYTVHIDIADKVGQYLSRLN
jgi:hypothetical protein